MSRYPRGLTIKSVDANHAAIVQAARSLGFAVVDTHTIGRGVPDCVIVRPSDQRAWLVEIKTMTGTLTEPERDYALRSRTPVHIVRTVEELLKLLEVTR